jgi:hypothetical protein
MFTVMPRRQFLINRCVDVDGEYTKTATGGVEVRDFLNLCTSSAAADNVSGIVSQMRRGIRHVKL